MYDELTAKFYSIVLQFRKLVEAQETLSVKTGNWLKIAKDGGESAFSTLEGLVGKLHGKFVEKKGIEDVHKNGQTHRKKSGNSQIAKVQEGYLERSKHMLIKLNEVRRALQKQLPSPYNLLRREVNRLISIGRDFVGFLTLATVNLADRIYLPTSNFVKTKLMANKQVIQMQVYLNTKKDEVINMLENNERFKQLKRFVIVNFEDQTMKMKMRITKMKELKQELENFIREVIVLARQKDVPLKQLPTKVYSLALEMYKKKNNKQQIANAPVSNGTTTSHHHGSSKKGKKNLIVK